MRPLQAKIIADLHVQPTIDPALEVRRSVDFLKNYLLQNPQYTSYVIAVSGGQDSTLAGKLARLATQELTAETGQTYQLIAIRQPYGQQLDEPDALAALAFIDADRVITTNIKTATDAMTLALRESGLVVDDLSRGSIKPKMRMIAQYAVAREYQGVVIGTDHAAEAFAGFFTKYGDGGTDINPLWRLNKRQGRAMLQALAAPQHFMKKYQRLIWKMIAHSYQMKSHSAFHMTLSMTILKAKPFLLHLPKKLKPYIWPVRINATNPSQFMTRGSTKRRTTRRVK